MCISETRMIRANDEPLVEPNVHIFAESLSW